MGRLKNGTITRCYADGGSVSGVDKIGGLVGDNDSGTISSCNATAGVSGDDRVGGLVGWYASQSVVTVTYCYSTGRVTGTGKVGGLIGQNNQGEISASLWDVQTSGRSNMCGLEGDEGSGCDDGNGRTTVQMQTMSTFTNVGWDFLKIWSIEEGVGYPKLRGPHPGDFDFDESNGSTSTFFNFSLTDRSGMSPAISVNCPNDSIFLICSSLLLDCSSDSFTS